ncbi:MAG: penicillin-insensitive murein endopeptidase [Rhodomicrobium sp.]
MRVTGLLLNGVAVTALMAAGFAAFAGPAAFSPLPGAPEAAASPAAQPAPAPQPQFQTQTVPEAQPAVAGPGALPASPAAKASAAKKAVAKDLFGAVKLPANMATRSIGFYARGCLAGGKPLPVNGPAWQVMRLSRNRNWGHPSLIKYVERFATDAKAKDGWPGLLVGDLSMPRGGPMPFGHKSHQIGLDVDIWYKPAPDHELTAAERESVKMESFLLDPGHVNPEVWKPEYEKLLRRAVSYPEVARIFVHPAIKKWLCDNVKGDRGFLSKISPILGHDDHFHVRLVCPGNNPGCEGQTFKAEEGCGKGLDKWIEALMKPKPGVPVTAAQAPKTYLGVLKGKVIASKDKLAASKKKGGLTLGQLPPECEAVLKAAPAPVPAATAAR